MSDIPPPDFGLDYSCPLTGCEWTLAAPRSTGRQRQSFAPAPGQNAEGYIAEIAGQLAAEARKTAEDRLREHAESHDVVDYLRTIQAQQTLLATVGRLGVEVNHPDPRENFGGLADLDRAVNDAGPRPDIHRSEVERLARAWPSLTRAIADVLTAAGKPVPGEWRR